METRRGMIDVRLDPTQTEGGVDGLAVPTDIIETRLVQTDIATGLTCIFLNEMPQQKDINYITVTFEGQSLNEIPISHAQPASTEFALQYFDPRAGMLIVNNSLLDKEITIAYSGLGANNNTANLQGYTLVKGDTYGQLSGMLAPWQRYPFAPQSRWGNITSQLSVYGNILPPGYVLWQFLG
jgi:hypothetical protein